jgi:hypothetical protein
MNMRVNRTVELIFMLFVMVTLPVIAVAHEKNVASRRGNTARILERVAG